MFCKKLSPAIKKFAREIEGVIEAHVDTAVAVTGAIRKILKSPVGEVLVAIIPGEVDNYIREKVIQGLGVALDALQIVDTCKGEKDLEKKLQCWMSEIRKLPGDVQEALLHKLAALMLRKIDGKALPQSRYDSIIQGKVLETKLGA